MTVVLQGEGSAIISIALLGHFRRAIFSSPIALLGILRKAIFSSPSFFQKARPGNVTNVEIHASLTEGNDI